MSDKTFESECPRCGWKHTAKIHHQSKLYYCIKCHHYYHIDQHGTQDIEWGEIAVHAAEIIEDGAVSDPLAAWENAVQDMGMPSSRAPQASLARDTFLWLCETGVVYGVTPCGYTASGKVKQCVQDALKQIRVNPLVADHPDQLKKKTQTDDASKSMIDVILALWDNGLIRG